MSNSIKVKRQVIVKTIVTEDFKNRAISELLNEIKLIDNQINHVQVQINQLIQQFQQPGMNNLSLSQQEADQIIGNMNLKIQQLSTIKQKLQVQIDNVNSTNLDDRIITGSLENYVDLSVGDNIYEALLEKEIVVKDSVVQEINI